VPSRELPGAAAPAPRFAPPAGGAARSRRGPAGRARDGQRLVAPGLAPGDADWKAAAADVRRRFLPGDLIVAAAGVVGPLDR